MFSLAYVVPKTLNTEVQLKKRTQIYGEKQSVKTGKIDTTVLTGNHKRNRRNRKKGMKGNKIKRKSIPLLFCQGIIVVFYSLKVKEY